MKASIREGITGTAAALGGWLASIPLERINTVLTSVSLLFGVVIGGITIFRIFTHKDLEAITERLEAIEDRCGSCWPGETEKVSGEGKGEERQG